jgi:hypothetical protein
MKPYKITITGESSLQSVSFDLRQFVNKLQKLHYEERDNPDEEHYYRTLVFETSDTIMEITES